VGEQLCQGDIVPAQLRPLVVVPDVGHIISAYSADIVGAILRTSNTATMTRHVRGARRKSSLTKRAGPSDKRATLRLDCLASSTCARATANRGAIARTPSASTARTACCSRRRSIICSIAASSRSKRMVGCSCRRWRIAPRSSGWACRWVERTNVGLFPPGSGGISSFIRNACSWKLASRHEQAHRHA
jgi:hypothetical protein